MPPEPIKTSFIPKASLKVERRQETHGAPIALASLIATIILILAVAGGAGMFLFKEFLIGQINSKKDSLDRARAAFQPDTIKELARIDTRLMVGSSLLAAHTAPSLVLDEVARLTLASVRFGSFQFGTVGGLNKLTVSMNGTAKSFNAVALEADQFGHSEVLTNPVFSNMNFDATGNVSFDVTADVNPSAILYLTSPAAPASAATSTPSGSGQAP
jgi:hypothetical protein